MDANDVRTLRMLAGMSQTEMGKMLGMGKRSYLRRETGQQEFRKAELVLLHLWWHRLRANGLKFRVVEEIRPRYTLWNIWGEIGGRTWKALGPYDFKADAEAVLRGLEREGL
jgi:DNA-binding XRE family transcriptional regulator